MVIVNFAHPLTEKQKAQVETIAAQKVDRVITVASQFDETLPFTEQARIVVDATNLSPQEWQTLPFILSLPSLSVIAALVLAEVNGRAGYFPSVLRMCPASGIVRQFDVAEILDLQRIRDQARTRRST